jgi:molecular chaperone GrpE
MVTADSTNAESTSANLAAPNAGPSAAELEDRWRRAVAEQDNLRKRYERQLDQARRAERDRVSAAWLPVLDHLELAVQHAQAEPATIVAGVRAVLAQALEVLRGLGYQRIEDVGAQFDPAVHEAAQVIEDPAAEPNTVVEVLRSGYVGEQSVLRPAVVAVAGGRE